MMFEFKLHMKVARCIARKDYARALEYLDQIRVSEEPNPYTVYMMAKCHEWSGDTESAMSAAKEALSIDNGHFESLKLLANLYLAKKDYKKTTEYVQAALNNYPEPVPGPPRFFFWLLRVLSFIPAIGKLGEAVRDDLEDPDKDTKSWFKWAKKYIEWYEDEYREKTGPTLH